MLSHSMFCSCFLLLTKKCPRVSKKEEVQYLVNICFFFLSNNSLLFSIIYAIFLIIIVPYYNTLTLIDTDLHFNTIPLIIRYDITV